MSAAHVLITGGAGFVGANLARRLLDGGERVVLLDDLSRPSVERNAAWLRGLYGDRVTLVRADVRDGAAVRRACEGATAVFHFASQVAVTRSLVDPRADFEVNALGTLEVLEAVRALDPPPLVCFTSTNKVYGALDDEPLRALPRRWEPEDPRLRLHGVSEDRRLDCHSPYGCSKGAADQYVVDFARSYGLDTVVFRMSCIYGPRQFGTEDQGWIAHFLHRAARGEPITIYGDGRQVRDALFIDDLVEAFLLAREQRGALRGRAFNIGGGPGNALSLLELCDLVEALIGRRPETVFQAARTGDQRYYVSDTRRFSAITGWAPRVRLDEGIARLHDWIRRCRLEGGA